ncbi:uncharacterized protein DUF1524 [Chitinophaga skermanii]|uniref:Uncharacterized protein DUF1524 n=1 Tax=Chitinophaga skermanii TaxID=331697 RepID=A0A327QRI8_9BACT|nr:DUF262 domain-containing protein [Chitinophaga skermanii]RAJ06871.1 uncharacterized protein DUF1524 [Chitinophaga skermanii]
MDQLTSHLYSLQHIIANHYRFNIPLYQRLYVWQIDHVRTLFNDLYKAFKSGKKSSYYIGGIILVKNKHNDGVYDLVDGQQRFTTLWLLALELEGALKAFSQTDQWPRIQFSIRTIATKYFRNELSNINSAIDDDDKDYREIKRIDEARMKLQELITSSFINNEEKQEFSKYIFDNLAFCLTIVPQKTDLNKLFEALNNRGEQLSQDALLKAQILDKIKNSQERWAYAKIWEVCSDMNNYLDNLLKEHIEAKTLADYYDSSFNINKIKALLNTPTEVSSPKSIHDIINAEQIEKEEKIAAFKTEDNTTNAEQDELQSGRSILTFPQLLLHTLRIFLRNENKDDIEKINEKELVRVFDNYFFSIFKGDDAFIEAKCTKFIELLFKVREAFDQHIVKWVPTANNTEELIIKRLVKNSKTLERDIFENDKQFIMLQSILYHTQDNTTQYWLTPFLYSILNKINLDAPKELELLDNQLFCTKNFAPLITRTWKFMQAGFEHQKCETSTLLEASGTRFPHYWFYKIEYILWKKYAQTKGYEHWKDYRITSKNSIEHISPQNPRDPADKVCVEMLHNLGNLVLVTRSINSEYSDQSYKLKQARFLEKKRKGFLDSLKSDQIYTKWGSDWNDDAAMAHQQAIIKDVREYLGLE